MLPWIRFCVIAPVSTTGAPLLAVFAPIPSTGAPLPYVLLFPMSIFDASGVQRALTAIKSKKDI